MSDQQGYKSFLLRLWQVRTTAGTVWRASLEEPHTGIRLGFSSVHELHEFLLDPTVDKQQQNVGPVASDPSFVASGNGSYTNQEIPE